LLRLTFYIGIKWFKTGQKYVFLRDCQVFFSAG
jgi:hypothetical protein